MSVADFHGLSVRELRPMSVAAEYLASSLTRGELGLFLGAGISISVGLPDWKTLVANCETELGISGDTHRSTDALTSAMDKVRRTATSQGDESQFRSLVRRNLYPTNFGTSGEYPDSILSQPILIALGAMVMPSARGSIAEVITLNFDDLLEWYLGLHGFSSQSIAELPTYLRSDRDVTIFHPHGFLPLTSKYEQTEWLVLTRKEFTRRISGTSGAAWPTFLTNFFATKRSLIVGTSMSDIDIHVFMDKANAERPDDGPSGFVINSGFEEGDEESLLEMNLVPVSVGSQTRSPLSCCRCAGEPQRSAPTNCEIDRAAMTDVSVVPPFPEPAKHRKLAVKFAAIPARTCVTPPRMRR